MGIVLGDNRYGKAETHVVRVVRDTARHEVRDLVVSTALRGDFAAAHDSGDQVAVLPTDTQKNTVLAYARRLASRRRRRSRPRWRGTSSTTSRRSGPRASRCTRTCGTARRSTAHPTTTPSYA